MDEWVSIGIMVVRLFNRWRGFLLHSCTAQDKIVACEGGGGVPARGESRVEFGPLHYY
jgi:hypothetical protein